MVGRCPGNKALAPISVFPTGAPATLLIETQKVGPTDVFPPPTFSMVAFTRRRKSEIMQEVEEPLWMPAGHCQSTLLPSANRYPFRVIESLPSETDCRPQTNWNEVSMVGKVLRLTESESHEGDRDDDGPAMEVTLETATKTIAADAVATEKSSQRSVIG